MNRVEELLGRIDQLEDKIEKIIDERNALLKGKYELDSKVAAAAELINDIMNDKRSIILRLDEKMKENKVLLEKVHSLQEEVSNSERFARREI